MKTFIKKRPLILTFIIILLGWTVFYVLNIKNVPFHPDESTQIYMSEDVDLFISNPSTLFYAKNHSNNQKQTYRFLDSPLTRYTIGIWRNLANLDPLEQDWDWSATWQENQGAVPEPTLLFLSRLGISIVFPISIVLLFFTTKRIFSIPTALIASTLFMTNAVVLLHTRRAMAEGLLLFFMLLSIYVIFSLKPNKLFLSAVPIAFAINTKQSLLFLIPAALLFFLFNNKFSLKVVKQILLFLSIIIVFTAFLNPVLWNHPIEAINTMISERAILLKSQTMMIQSVSPDFILDTPSERLIGFIAQTFVTPPAYQDVANYQHNLQPAIDNYQQNMIHSGIFRSMVPGLLLFIISLVGLILVLIEKQKLKFYFLIFFFFAFAEIMIAFPIPFQRYYLPLYPFIFIFISELITRVITRLKKNRNPELREAVY